jgi:phytoene dehydrogenase-like protein
MAGLICAFHLQRNGLKFLVLEASEAPGSRIRTDQLDAFLLDRGFDGIFLCGDYLENASLNGALLLGRRAAADVTRLLEG